MKISVVVRCLNEAAHVETLIEGLKKQSTPVHEIIFVDSGSTDGTLEIIERLADKVLHIDRSEFSFGRSLNRGIAAASGELVLICSAHVYPLYDDWVGRLAAHFDRPTVAYAYGRQVGDHRTKYSEAQVMSTWFPAKSIPKQAIAFANNANSMIRRDVWLDRPFDEGLTGLEDVAWAKATLESGLDLAYDAGASVHHVHEESWSIIRNRYRREAIAYKRIMQEDDMTALSAARLAFINIVRDYASAWRDGVLVSNFREIPTFRISQFYGAWQGFSQRLPEAELLSRFYYPKSSIESEETFHGVRIEYGKGIS